MPAYRSSPPPISTMPPGIPYIVGNEAAERFSFYGMRTILTVFMVKYLWLMGERAGTPMSDAEAVARFHWFAAFVYLTPFLGALLADGFLGKYRVIILLSLVYCLGHASLAFMGVVGQVEWWFLAGLWLIILGSGGIKPCVSAHVGDQFGSRNSHLLPRIFNWFYWAINLGAFASTLLTPWLLEWHGPHWAFGVPGILMALATLVFWMGRWKFVHIPARGWGFVREALSGEGLRALLKLCVIYLFIAVFWALFDQQSSSWVLQAEDMDRRWLGVEWLPSQIQVINPILILTFIPLFAYVLYPAIDRVFPLTPLRKMSIGFFLMVAAFAVVAVAQEKIDAGETPSISWQLAGFVLMTAAEVMISIVGLEFSYTQAPRSMKSFIMALFFLAVFAGNHLVSLVNKGIQVQAPVPAEVEVIAAREAGAETGGEAPIPVERTFAGHDGETGTGDDLVATYGRDGKRIDLIFRGKDPLESAVAEISGAIEANGFETLSESEGNRLLKGKEDPWGQPFRYTQVNRSQCRVASPGPDGEFLTPWDQGAAIEVARPPAASEGRLAQWMSHLRPDTPWLERRKTELGLPTEAERTAEGASVSHRLFVGGQVRLEGAAYFWFFTWLMLGTAVVFVVVAQFYRPKEYLHREEGG